MHWQRGSAMASTHARLYRASNSKIIFERLNACLRCDSNTTGNTEDSPQLFQGFSPTRYFTVCTCPTLKLVRGWFSVWFESLGDRFCEIACLQQPGSRSMSYLTWRRSKISFVRLCRQVNQPWKHSVGRVGATGLSKVTSSLLSTCTNRVGPILTTIAHCLCSSVYLSSSPSSEYNRSIRSQSLYYTKCIGRS